MWIRVALCLGLCVWGLGGLLGGCDPSAPTEPAARDGGAGKEQRLADTSTPPPKLVEGPLIQYVDPFIGTGGIGFAVGSSLPGATAPFGMVKVSPDTASHERGLGFQHCAGYYYLDKEIHGFSHIHLHGTGVPDYGNILVMPLAGPLAEGSLKEPGYRSTYSHDTEKASPGYYTVYLDRSKTKVELTATPRAAYHRYTYDASDKERLLLLRMDHTLPGGEVTQAELTLKDDKTLEGWLHNKGALSKRAGGYEVYFVLRSKTPFDSGTWKQGKLSPEKSQKGVNIGAWLKFGEGKEPVEFQVGVSFVSIAQARLNLETELKGWDFDGTRKATEAAWEKLLSVARISGGTQAQRRIFYTALYHSFQMPTLFTDVNGKYRGFDKKVHEAKGYTYYSDFSLWDTYRTLHPLLILLTPKEQLDMVKSLLQMAREGGDLPRWPLATGYTSTMVGASADIVIADTYLKGYKDFDVEFAFQSMVRLAMKKNPPGAKFGGRNGIEHYVKHGFVDASAHSGSASVTLEYAYNDFSIAQLAKALGKTKEADAFAKRATNYRHIWDPKTQFFRGKKSDGSWLEGFEPLRWTKDYVEGTAWQYLWFVPHDPEGLAKLFGSKQKLFQKLDEFWAKSKQEHETKPKPLAPRSYYWHGNEPDLHAALVYLQLGKPHLSHKWVRWIMKTKYDDTPAGLAGNDDCGTLSAWYAFNAMGLYPIPGRDLYLISTPIFSRISIQVQGKTLEILAPKTSEKALYVKKVSLNGDPLPQMWVKHTDLLKNKHNTLRFEMSETPP